MSPHIIQCENLTATYPPRTALHDITCTITRGHLHMVIGGNGAGKSTLLRCWAGLHRPASGTVHWHWREHGAAPLAYLGEADYLYAGATVAENLFLTAALCGRPHTDAEKLLTAWQLDAWRERRCQQLSRGERRKVALARAWLAGRELLLLDEPLVGLDPDGVAQVRTMIAHALTQGRTIVLAVQTMHALEHIACTTTQLAKGRVAHAA